MRGTQWYRCRPHFSSGLSELLFLEVPKGTHRDDVRARALSIGRRSGAPGWGATRALYATDVLAAPCEVPMVFGLWEDGTTVPIIAD